MSAQPVHAPWPATPRAVPEARHAVRDLLADAGRVDLVAAAELLVTELVTNVVLHAGGTVEVRAELDDQGLLLEVVDGSPVLPAARLFSGTATTGRGLRLVHALAAEHGVRPLPGDAGKAVWLRLTAEGAARSDEEAAAAFALEDWGDLDAPGAEPGGPVALLARAA